MQLIGRQRGRESNLSIVALSVGVGQERIFGRFFGLRSLWTGHHLRG